MLLMETFTATQRKACELAHISRSSYRYKPETEKNDKLKEKLTQLAHQNADSGEGERLFRRERERHSGPKANSARSVATLALRLCRKCSASSSKTVRSEA